jgi:hypothetical protein
MKVLPYIRKIFIALTLVFFLTTTVACSTTTPERTSYNPGVNQGASYTALARGDSPAGQSFGDWVVQTSRGLIQDAYVRNNNKLGVVISPNVRPNEVKPLAQSLVQGFRRSTPNQDVTVLVYAPDKQLILKASYDAQSKQVDYDA